MCKWVKNSNNKCQINERKSIEHASTLENHQLIRHKWFGIRQTMPSNRMHAHIFYNTTTMTYWHLSHVYVWVNRRRCRLQSKSKYEERKKMTKTTIRAKSNFENEINERRFGYLFGVLMSKPGYFDKNKSHSLHKTILVSLELIHEKLNRVIAFLSIWAELLW